MNTTQRDKEINDLIADEWENSLMAHVSDDLSVIVVGLLKAAYKAEKDGRGTDVLSTFAHIGHNLYNQTAKEIESACISAVDAAAEREKELQE